MRPLRFVCLLTILLSAPALVQSIPVPPINQTKRVVSPAGPYHAAQQARTPVASGGGKPTTSLSRVSGSGGGTAAIQRSAAKVKSKQIRADDSIQFDPTTLKASYGSVGLYNLVGLGTWNGQPVSPTNMPDDAQRLLAATINFYVLPGASNVMYMQVTDVLTTTGAYWFGTAFDDVTQTGVQIAFPDPSILSLEVSYSGAYANPGEVLADGTSGTEIDTPLTSTPGFTMDAPLNSTLLIHTVSGAANGFTSLFNITGTTRIRGGGVFQLTFDPTVDLTQLDFSKLQVESEYGLENQFILASNPVPLLNQPLVPTSIAPGSPQFTLTVNGTGFVPASVVNWNGSLRATTFVNNSQLQAVILSSDIAEAGTALVTVKNPSPGGGNSNTEFLLITNPDSSLAFNLSNTTAGNDPVRLVTSDFNGDGILDIATANEIGNTVTVMLGKGDGTFQSAVTYPAGGQPFSIAIGDFNSDGYLDLVVTNLCPGYPTCSGATVSVLLGNGDGTFQSQVQYATGNGPDAVSIGDFNGDGKLDLAITSLTDSSVCIFLGNGDGTFQPYVEYPVGTITPNGVTTGDFNGDGVLDLALTTCCTEPGVIAVLQGNGDGTFQPPAFYDTAIGYLNAIQTADLNGDGKLDLIATGIGAGSESGGVSVLLGNGDGTFQTHVDYLLNTAVDSVAIGDFNGDGIPDLAATHINPAGQVSILLGNGEGTFGAAVNIPTGFDPAGVLAADFNGDGRLDIVTGNRDTTISVLLQSPVVALVPTALSFATQNVGTSGTSQNVTLTNSGSAILKISSIVIIGPNSGDFSQQNNCGSSVIAAATCTITVTFDPTAPGPRSGSVSISDNGLGSPQTIQLSGTGLALATTTTIASLTNPSAFGQYVIFMATVASQGSGTPTGTVTFAYGSTTPCNAVALSGGTATCASSALPVGSDIVTATYSDGSEFSGSSGSVNQTVNQASTTLALTSSFNPSGLDSPVTFTATITPQYGGQAFGAVTFKDGATILGSGTVSGNAASLTTSGLAMGTHSITAVYSGDSNFTGSTSNRLSQVVTRAMTTITLLSSINPSVQGKSVTFTAMVSSLAGTPTGKVEFLNGTTVLAKLTLTSGSAKYSTSKLPPGSDSITAVYEGDSNNNLSTSAPVNQFVIAATTTKLSSSPNPSRYGEAAVFTATVTSSMGSPPDGQTVTFKQGATVLGAGTLSSGTATFSDSTLTVGTKSIEAVYVGDTNFASSTSKTVSQVVSKATSTTTLASSQNPSTYGQPVTFTATVAPQFSGTPSGTVVFKDGTTTLTSVKLSGGTAGYTTSTLTTGTHTITATYNGSTSFSSSSSAPLTQTIQ
jgi:hypothetical protein